MKKYIHCLIILLIGFSSCTIQKKYTTSKFSGIQGFQEKERYDQSLIIKADPRFANIPYVREIKSNTEIHVLDFDRKFVEELFKKYSTTADSLVITQQRESKKTFVVYIRSKKLLFIGYQNELYFVVSRASFSYFYSKEGDHIIGRFKNIEDDPDAVIKELLKDF